MIFHGMMVAESLSIGVNEGNHYVLGGYGKFFHPQGVFLYTGIAQCRHRVTEVFEGRFGSRVAAFSALG